MSATGFTTGWLEERYRVDTNARSGILSDLFIQHLGVKTNHHLLDLGAGIGSNVKYFCDKIKSDQYWYLLEIDQNLIDYGKSSIEEFLTANNYHVQTNKREILAKKNHAIHIRYIPDSIFNIQPTQFLAFDGILGNALLDVFTLGQLQQLFKNLRLTHAPKLFSIIYQNMEWLDDDVDNAFFVKKYHQHMQREQPHGGALGPDCIETIQSQFLSKKENVLFEKSPWKVKASDKILLFHLLNFYKESIPEIIDPEVISRFNRWYTLKEKRLDNSTLKVNVEHQDLLILFQRD